MRVFFDEKLKKQSLEIETEAGEDLNKEQYGEETYFYGAIKNLNANDIMLLDGAPAESFKLYCDIGTQIKEGDLITDEKGRKYTIRTIRESKMFNIELLRADLNLLRQGNV